MRKHQMFEKIQARLKNKVVKPEDKPGPKRKVEGSVEERFLKKVLGEAGYRPDMVIADWRKLDQNSATVLIQYQKALGKPTKADVYTFFERAFPNTRFVIYEETAKNFASAGAMSLIVKRAVPTRPVEDAGHMRKITASTFLDVELGEVWKIEEKEGHKFLARVMDDDVSSVLHRYQMKIKAPVRASIKEVLGAVNVGVGDKVRFYADGKTLSGEITKVDDVTGQVVIKAEDGKNYTVAKEAIYFVSELGQQHQKEKDDTIYNYYAEIYGPDIAKKLVSKE